MTKQQDSVTSALKRTKKTVETVEVSKSTKTKPKSTQQSASVSTKRKPTSDSAVKKKVKIASVKSTVKKTKTVAAKPTIKKAEAAKTTKPKFKKTISKKTQQVSDDFASAWLCAKAMLNKKGEEVIILDLRQAQSAPADFFVICTCESTIQSKAVASEVDNQWRKQDWQVGKSEGWDVGEWIILDYFDVVVHVFLREKREYFKLEKLWSDGIFYSVQEDGTIHPIQRK